ncbi:MAG TPA: hypothetical protein VEW92_04905 [Nitrososphaeraceae archaeon]|jgi:hypothetical protein|nr:hypothetical protein [Nitrososphaeraceae archaeon]
MEGTTPDHVIAFVNEVYNKFLIIKAKYMILLSLHGTPLLEPLSVLLPTGPLCIRVHIHVLSI